ncbi:ArsR/SmtB family transcription factor [Rhizobium sp. 2YAF20]|uniref:ArsR/SmtB family transcription factor n=1 Tax=Rhizobium sp. 2YAF20 TaxID=3233027 RepID=UPI003F967E5A
MNEDMIHKALSSPFRRQVLQWLKDPSTSSPGGISSVGLSGREIETLGGLSQSTTSTHLKLMCSAGLVTVRRHGQIAIFSRNEDTIAKFAATMTASL